jgi:hypothetical protein
MCWYLCTNPLLQIRGFLDLFNTQFLWYQAKKSESTLQVASTEAGNAALTRTSRF